MFDIEYYQKQSEKNKEEWYSEISCLPCIEGLTWFLKDKFNEPGFDYEQFIKDAAFQYYILKRCGIRVGKIHIVIHGPDEENPFVPREITAEAKALAPWINDHIWDLNRMQKEREEVKTEPGDQCIHPYECWYYDYCHNTLKEEQIQFSLTDTE